MTSINQINGVREALSANFWWPSPFSKRSDNNHKRLILQMTNRHMKRCLIPFIITEMQLNTTVK